MYGSGAVSCSCSLLIRGPNLARCQAEAPLIALCRFSKPALPAHSLIHARLRASIDGLDEGEFTEGHELERKWRVPTRRRGSRILISRSQHTRCRLLCPMRP